MKAIITETGKEQGQDIQQQTLILYLINWVVCVLLQPVFIFYNVALLALVALLKGYKKDLNQLH